MNNHVVYANVEDIHTRYTTKDFKHAITFIIGSKNEGKTTLAKNIISISNPTSVIVSDLDHQANSELDDVNYTKVNTDNILTTTLNLVKSGNNGHILLWIRDVDNYNFKHKLNNLLIHNRAYNLSIIIEMQYSRIPPNIRAQIDHVFILKCNSIADQKKYYEYFMSYISFESARQYINNLKNDLAVSINDGKISIIKYHTDTIKPILKKLVIPEIVEDTPTKQSNIKSELIEIRKTITKLIEQLSS